MTALKPFCFAFQNNIFQFKVRTCSFLLLAGLIALPFVQPTLAAEPDDEWGNAATNPVPYGAVATIETDKPEYFIGENVLVHFILTNVSSNPFNASFGGDYRGAGRELRFKITATHENGVIAEDPIPFPACLGGVLQNRTIEPGEALTFSQPLMRYCQIKQPGAYAIRATHDFGWKEGDRKRPVAETTISFRLPDAAEAEEVVAQMESLPKAPNNSWGQRSRNYADFTCLRHPVYVAPLLQRAQCGDSHALQGLELIPTPEATEALIRLAGHPDSKLALAGATSLGGRLPLPPEDPHFSTKSGIFYFAKRRNLAEQSWNPNFAAAARSVASNLLAHSAAASVAMGANILRSIGITNDAPILFSALDRALDPLHTPRRDPKDNILDSPQPIRELGSALTILEARGYTLGRGLSGKGQILLYFQSLTKEPPPRPDRWLRIFNAFGTSGKFPLREAALRSIPEPMPAECIPHLLRSLEDPDLGVCRVACEKAGQSGNPIFLPSLLEIIATEHHTWLLRAATSAARSLGAEFDLYEAWVDRLAEEELYILAIDSLQSVLDVPQDSYPTWNDLSRRERLALREAWREFLALHADEIRAGKRFKVDDPAVTPALAGRARRWKLPDGSSWPPRSPSF